MKDCYSYEVGRRFAKRTEDHGAGAVTALVVMVLAILLCVTV